MLSLLLDEQISPVVAAQIMERCPGSRARSVYHYRQGAMTSAPDASVLRAAAEDELALVTYDQKTIPPLLVEWGNAGISHAGIIFVDERTIASADFGGLVNALVHLWDREHATDWRNRTVFLRPA